MGKSEGTIKHFATVVNEGRQRVKVVLDGVSPEECGGCHLVGVCGKGGKTEMLIRTTPDAPQLHAGDRVLLTADAGVQTKAVIWTLVLPVSIFLAAILGLSGTDCAGWVVALTSLGAVVVYYLLLWLAYPRIFKSEMWEISLIK